MVEKRSTLDHILDVLNVILVGAVFISVLYPFLYIINYSISTPHKILFPLMLWPQSISFSSYQLLFGDPNFLGALTVSLMRTFSGPVLTLIVSGMAAYGMSRRNLVFGKTIRLFLIMPMYFSAGMIPTYIVVYNLGLSGTFWIYIIPSAAASFFMLLIKTYIESIPESLEEAVLVDGGTEVDAYFRVILPVCLPINAAVLMFAAIGQWNAFMDTQIYNATNREMHTLQYSLYVMVSQRLYSTLEKARENASNNNITPTNLQMAMAVLNVVPIMMVYPFLQRYFVSGIMIGSVKA